MGEYYETLHYLLNTHHIGGRYNIETLPFFSCPQAAKWQFLSDRVRKIFACKDKYDPKVLWLLLLLEDTIIRHGYFMRWCRVSAVVSSILEIRSWFVVYKKFPYKNIALRLFIIVTIINFHFRFRFCVPICEWLSWKKIIVIIRSNIPCNFDPFDHPLNWNEWTILNGILYCYHFLNSTLSSPACAPPFNYD